MQLRTTCERQVALRILRKWDLVEVVSVCLCVCVSVSVPVVVCLCVCVSLCV